MKSLIGKMAAVIAGVFAFLGFAAFAGLPSGYTQLQWIESDGHQWIDTGIKAQSDLIVSADMRLLSNEPAQAIFGGADDGNSVNPLAVTAKKSSDKGWYTLRVHCNKYNSNKSTTASATLAFGAYRHLGQRAVWKMDDGYFTFNGYHPDFYVYNDNTFTSTNNIYICWMSGPKGGSTTFKPAAMMLYGFDIQMKSDSSYLRKMVPVIRDSDGEIGLLDTANDVFYPNLGTKPFLAGPRVSCVYPSETGASVGYRSELTISGYSGGAAVQSGLPVLVRISPSKIAGFSYGSCLAGGADVFFATDTDGLNRLACDIDTWDTAGESLAWVKLPEVTGTNTKFYMFWGGGEAAERPASKEVWSDYVAVWHMNSCDAVTGVADETGHGFNATNSPSNVSTPIDSVFGTGLNLSHGLYAPNYETYMTIPTNTIPDVVSMSCWFRKPSGVASGSYQNILYKYGIVNSSYRVGYAMQTVNGSTVNFKDYVANARKSAASSYSPDNTALPDYTENWLHHVFVTEGTNLISYINGAQKVKASISTSTDAVGKYNDNLRFGTSANPIDMDEVRITRVPRSASWVKAEYDMMTNSEFVVAGSAESLQVAVSIAGTPAQYAANAISYGTDTDVSIGTPKTYTAPEIYNVDATNRAVCAGWTLYATDPTEGFVLARTSDNPLAGESTTTCIITPTGNDALTWVWTEERFIDAAASVEGQGTIIGGGWCTNDVDIVLTAVPAEGYYFSCWTGATDGVEDIYSTNITVAVDMPKVLRAVFRPTTDCVFECSESGTVDFFDPANWMNGNAPASDGTSVVVIRRPPEGVSVTAIASNALDVASLDVCYGSGTGSFTLQFGCGLATNKVSGDVILRTGSTFTHTRHSTTANSKVYALNLEVGGDMTVETGASVDASKKGYYFEKGPMPSSKAGLGGGHGGVGSGGYNSSNYKVHTAKCYGSIRRPDQPGSGGGYSGSYNYGGGVIHLSVTNGTLTLNGSVSANGGDTTHSSPAGGSVWIECGTLVGSGGIDAYAGRATNYSHGGGGRIAVRQYAANSLSAYTGLMRAGRNPVMSNSYNGYHAVGSIYIENANDGEDRGELIVEGYDLISNYPIMACRLDSTIVDVAEPFGKVSVKNYARLEVPSGVTLKVTKGISVSSSGDFHTVDAGGAVEIMPGEDGEFSVAGLVKACNIYCTNSPGATISFAAGAQLRNLENGSIELYGTEAKPLSLVPATADGTWTMNVVGPDSSKSYFEYIALSNCDATVGVPLVALRSADLGGNDNWGFISGEIPEGSVFTWIGGAEGSLWNTPANWDQGIVPRETDHVRIPAGCSSYPVLEYQDIYVSSLTNESGASFTLDGVDLFVSNALYSAGTIVDGGRRIVAYGDGDTVLDFASGTAAKVYIEKTGGSVTCPSGFTAEKFYCVTSDALEFAFGAGEEFEFAQCNIESKGSSPHILGSTAPGEQWALTLTTRQRVRNVTVSDSDASGGAEVKVSTSFATDDGNNLNWSFGNIVEWIAGTGNWATAANWSTGVVPGENDNVFIAPAFADATVTVGEAVSVRSLTLGGTDSAITLNSNYAVSMSGDLVIYSGATASLSAKSTANEIGGNVLVASGGKLTHAANSSRFYYRLNMAVGGDMTIEQGGMIDVRSKGFAQYYGPVDGTKNAGITVASGGAHGSTALYNGLQMNCYGSIFEPVMIGAGSYYNNGSGAVYLDVAGTLTVNGSINARSVRGTHGLPAAGSILVKAGTIAGTGTVSAACANGAASNYKGGAGRIALYQRTATDWSAASSLHVTTTNGCADASHGGTIYKELPGDGNRGGTIYIEGRYPGVSSSYGSGWLQFPMLDDGDPMRAYKKAKIVMSPYVYLRSFTNETFAAGSVVKVRDIEFTGYAQYTMLGVKLLVISSDHRDGTGWTGGNYASRTNSNAIATGSLGGIVWARDGFSVRVR